MMRFVFHSNLSCIANIIIFQVLYNSLAFSLMLISITGIEDPLHDGVCKAVTKCQKAGVTVKMCTGDNVLTTHFSSVALPSKSHAVVVMSGPYHSPLVSSPFLLA